MWDEIKCSSFVALTLFFRPLCACRLPNLITLMTDCCWCNHLMAIVFVTLITINFCNLGYNAVGQCPRSLYAKWGTTDRHIFLATPNQWATACLFSVTSYGLCLDSVSANEIICWYSDWKCPKDVYRVSPMGRNGVTLHKTLNVLQVGAQLIRIYSLNFNEWHWLMIPLSWIF